jgi:hypothetical protein
MFLYPVLYYIYDMDGIEQKDFPGITTGGQETWLQSIARVVFKGYYYDTAFFDGSVTWYYRLTCGDTCCKMGGQERFACTRVAIEESDFAEGNASRP